MKKQYSIFILLTCSSFIFSKHILDNINYSLEKSYVEYRAYYDNRQVVGSSADGKLLFPERRLPSAQKIGDTTRADDINAKGQGQMAAFRTRLHVEVFGTRINGAAVRGIVESDFEGRSGIFNIIRMRHAYIQLDWKKATMFFGQTWHPLWIRQVYPRTVSFNNGRPLEPYARYPQIRLIYHAPSLDIITAATSQLDFPSDGPDGEDTKYIRNAVIPNLHFQLKGFFGDHVAGIGADYKRLTPRIESIVGDQRFKVCENISSGVGVWYLGLNWPSFSFHTKLSYGQNMGNYEVIGGYAVKKDTINEETGERKYTNFRTLTFWSTFTINKYERVEPAVFIGVAKNFGASDQIERNVVDQDGNIIDKRVFGLEEGQFTDNIDTIFRISPRLRVKINKIVLAGEIEYTRAGYAFDENSIDEKGKVQKTQPVANTRVLFASYYYF